MKIDIDHTLIMAKCNIRFKKTIISKKKNRCLKKLNDDTSEQFGRKRKEMKYNINVIAKKNTFIPKKPSMNQNKKFTKRN